MDIKDARVMIVEDEKIMSTFLQTNLRRLGLTQLHAFTDGAAALKEIANIRPDLILTDVHMQPLGGIEFVRLLKSLPDSQLSSTKVIFLSADSSMSTVGEALPLGVQGYLVKPPNLVALQSKIELALRDKP